MNTKGFNARIVPAAARDSGVQPTQGTKVMVGDVALTGVTRIELVADVDDVWRAVIHCHANVTDLDALAIFHRPTARERIKKWLAFWLTPVPAGTGPR